MARVSRPTVPELTVESLTLDNGLRVRLIPLPHLQSATISYFCRAGSRYEKSGTNGLSHLLEHMLYRGTEEHPKPHELNLAIEHLGGTLDASTHVDSASYELTLPPETVDQGLALLAEVLQRPLLIELDTEKEIIREEILEDLNEQGEQIAVDNVSRSLLYPGHPLGFAIAGPLENLDRFDVTDLRKHHEEHYTARNSVLCVAGAFDAGAVKDDIVRFFGSFPQGAEMAITPPPFPDGRRLAYVHDPGSQTDVRLSFHIPGAQSDTAPTLLLLGRILDDGLSTRLHRTICEERGLAYEAFAETDFLEDCGVFDFGASVEHSKVPSLIDAMFELIEDLLRRPPDQDEIEKAKRRYVWDLRTVRDDPEETTDFVGSGALFGLSESLGVAADQVTRVTEANVADVVESYLRQPTARITCVGALDDSVLEHVRETLEDDVNPRD